MIERKVVLKNRTGLHARPASELVAFAKELPCKVYLEHNGKKAAADSILQLLALGAPGSCTPGRPPSAPRRQGAGLRPAGG